MNGSIEECVYCAVNSRNEIQWVKGSSTKTRYYMTDKHVAKAVEYHNKYNKNDLWQIKKFKLVEMKG